MTLLEYQLNAKRTCPELGITFDKNICTEEYSGQFDLISPNPAWESNLLINSIHMTIGINTEVGEIIAGLTKYNKEIESSYSLEIDKINLQEELGDILWYFVNYATFANFDLTNFEFKKEYYFQEEYTKNSNINPYLLLVIYASDLLDYDKKALAYKKIKHTEEVYNTFKSLFQAISDMFLNWDLDPYKAMQNNIDKLRIRYPEKFTSENAINRNLDKERIELEK